MMHACRIAVTDKNKRAGPRLEHEGEILTAHEGRRVRVHFVGPGYVRGHRRSERRLYRVILVTGYLRS